jgi:Xaa-Pro aminopeptidase
MSSTPRRARFDRVRAAMERAGADWLLVPASADLRWLTGVAARVSERLVALAFPRAGEPFLVAPRLEADALAEQAGGLPMLVWDEHEDPLERLAARAGFGPATEVRLGEGLSVAQVLRLASTTRCAHAREVLVPLRAIKDADELATLAEAARHADAIVEAAADHARPGMSERELARFVRDQFESLGDTEPWAIVATGPNSAMPHHESGEREIREGEVLLLDLGASTRGYASDITRTYFLGEPPRHVLRVYDVVNRAREAGIAAAVAGAVAESADAAARAVIVEAGLGEQFTHRTGHGLGLEVHEAPYLVAGDRTVLAEGHVHSVEPGVYLPGRFGIRLEDIVVVAARGARRLNQAPLDLRPPRSRS